MKKIKWIACLIFLIIFIVLGTLVSIRSDIHIDNIVYSFISNYVSDDLTIFMKNFTYIASAPVVIIITILTLIFFKNKKYGLFMSIDLILITLFQFLLKYTFTRNRPLDINLIEETGYSFPSGHSLTAMAFYGFIIYLVLNSNLNRKIKYVLTILLSIIIILVGLSRIYLGVHFFTDVIGGFSFSILFLIIYITIIQGKLNNEM